MFNKETLTDNDGQDVCTLELEGPWNDPDVIVLSDGLEGIPDGNSVVKCFVWFSFSVTAKSSHIFTLLL